MAQIHARSGEVVSVLPLGEQLYDARTRAILKAEQLEVVRVVLQAGQEMREHKTPGELTLHGIEGEVELRTPSAVQVLAAGDFIHLQRSQLHALRALTDAPVLLTMCLCSVDRGDSDARVASESDGFVPTLF